MRYCLWTMTFILFSFHFIALFASIFRACVKYKIKIKIFFWKRATDDVAIALFHFCEWFWGA